MCVFESSGDSDSTAFDSSTRPSHEDGNLSVVGYEDSDFRGNVERTVLPLGAERLSLVEQQETLPEVCDVNSEDQSSLPCFAIISARTTLSAALSNNTSELNDEGHFNISPRVSPESVYTYEQFAQKSAQMGGEAITSQVMAPNHQCTPSIMPLPLSPKETEEFDEMKSLEAINFAVADCGQPTLSSDLQSVDTTPFVKEELKERIKLRRQQRGLPSLKVEEDVPKPDILTPAEEEKRRLRRERNRIAAAKCRKKKKAKALEKKQNSKVVVEQTLALLEEKLELMKEKAKLEAMLNSHLMECNRADVIHLELPEITTSTVNTSQLELSDSDSMSEEAMLFTEESQSSDCESIDLTNDVDNQMLDSSIGGAMAVDVDLSSNNESLQQAVALLNSFGGNCFSSSGNMEFEYLPPS